MNLEKIKIESYLEGKLPLQPELTAVPSDEELEAAEAEFDSLVAQARSQAPAEAGLQPARRASLRVRAWAGLSFIAAASVILAFILWPQSHSVVQPMPSASTAAPVLANNTVSVVSESDTHAVADDCAKDAAAESRLKSLPPTSVQGAALAEAAPVSQANTKRGVEQQEPAQQKDVPNDYHAAELAAIEAETLAALSAVEAEVLQEAVEAQQHALATCNSPNQPS